MPLAFGAAADASSEVFKVGNPGHCSMARFALALDIDFVAIGGYCTVAIGGIRWLV